jgi:hypothetical protein
VFKLFIICDNRNAMTPSELNLVNFGSFFSRLHIECRNLAVLVE